MALFVDGNINGLSSLERYESNLLNVAGLEQIDIDDKMSLAQDMLASELLLFLLKQASENSVWSSSSGNSFTTASRRRLGVSDVVVTEPLQRWHALKSIELFYQDAYYNQLNDRYQAKWLQYQQRSNEAATALYMIGVGVAAAPIVRADSPLLVSIDGSNPAATYYIRMTWVNQSGQEGSPSDVVALQTVDGTLLVVTPGVAPANAAGWNVYAGSLPEGCSLQNDVPIGVQVDWSPPVAGLRDGAVIGNGQVPEPLHRREP